MLMPTGPLPEHYTLYLPISPPLCNSLSCRGGWVGARIIFIIALSNHIGITLSQVLNAEFSNLRCFTYAQLAGKNLSCVFHELQNIIHVLLADYLIHMLRYICMKQL